MLKTADLSPVYFPWIVQILIARDTEIMISGASLHALRNVLHMIFLAGMDVLIHWQINVFLEASHSSLSSQTTAEVTIVTNVTSANNLYSR
jgi:hypothetical protein